MWLAQLVTSITEIKWAKPWEKPVAEYDYYKQHDEHEDIANANLVLVPNDRGGKQ